MKENILESRKRALDYFKGQILHEKNLPYGVMRTSAHHDIKEWPSMLLPATYNGIMAINLLGEIDSIFTAEQSQSLAIWIKGFSHTNGAFYLPQITNETIGKMPHFNPDAAQYYDLERCWEYLEGHVTNYALGALDALKQLPNRQNFSFIAHLFDEKDLLAWLALRDMRDPWAEGNFIVNLASFYFLSIRGSQKATPKTDRLIQLLTEWHYRNIEPATGFWGIAQLSDARYGLHAMAGACHNYHLFFEQNLDIPHLDKAVDWCLAQPAQDVTTACIDVDLVDILANAYCRLDYRRPEIKTWLEQKLEAILKLQQADGGFPDDAKAEGERYFDTWIGGYREPQGISCNFATFFRLLTIAMISEALQPGAYLWNFRKMLGIGYFNRGDLPPIDT